MYADPTSAEMGMKKFLEGRKVRRKIGNEVKVISGDGVLDDVYHIAYYFGARWCESCVNFTPYLTDFYYKMKARGEKIEVIYVSSDRTIEEMEQFMLESHGDWLAVHGSYYNEQSDECRLSWFFRMRHFIERIPAVGIDYAYARLTSHGMSDIIEFGEDAMSLWTADFRNQCVKEYTWTKEEEALAAKSFKLGLEYKYNKNKLRYQCCKISRYPPWAPRTPLSILSDLTLSRKSGEAFVDERAEDALRGVQLIGFYFSANWCQPCQQFTPLLKRCYEQWKSSGESFEVVFMPKDKTYEEMKTYMREMHGDWLAVPYNQKWLARWDRKFGIDGIPMLCILSNTGEMIAEDGRRDIEIKGESSIEFWKQGVPATTYEDELVRMREFEEKEEAERRREEAELPRRKRGSSGKSRSEPGGREIRK